jgi:hypothetical protein
MEPATIDWLLEADNPSVRYFTLVDILGEPANGSAASAARLAIMEQGLVPQLLAMQNSDGSWFEPQKFYTNKYGGTVWCLLLLAELGAEPNDPRVQKACAFILEHSWNRELGGFSYQASVKGSGLAGGVIPCLTGNMVYSLIKLGCGTDERVLRAIDWINAWQRADDNEGPGPAGPIYDRLEVCWGRHSCHMGVAKTLKALAAIPAGQRDPATVAKIGELAEYFLKHHLYKKSHQLAEVAKPGWLKPGFPLMYQTDILELLGLFADLQIRDPRLADALAILRGKRRPDGSWLLENTFNGKMAVTIEQKGEPSKWITLKALRVLRALDGV